MTLEVDFIKIEGGAAVVRLEIGVYGLDPILKAAHSLTRLCYVHVETEDQGAVLCRLRAKQSLQDATHLAGMFVNEVLDQRLRSRLSEQTEPVRRLLMAQAFSKLNLLEPDLDTVSPQSDPLGIAAPDVPHHG
jgi:His-Xaa-Ser system protein HxsD